MLVGLLTANKSVSGVGGGINIRTDHNKTVSWNRAYRSTRDNNYSKTSLSMCICTSLFTVNGSR